MKRTADLPKTEAELCDAFAEIARTRGWDVYPECGGFDLLLVWNATVMPQGWGRLRLPNAPAGFQVGVEAKLRPNVEVLEQAASRIAYGAAAPDAGAVLVPQATRDFAALGRRLRLHVFALADLVGDRHRRGGLNEPFVVEPENGAGEARPRVTLPPIPLQGSGGQASPRVLSPWRVAALRLVIELRAKGSITRAEAKAIGIDPSHWVTRGWLRTDGQRPARYTELPRLAESDRGPIRGYERELELLQAQATGAPPTPREAA